MKSSKKICYLFTSQNRIENGVCQYLCFPVLYRIQRQILYETVFLSQISQILTMVVLYMSPWNILMMLKHQRAWMHLSVGVHYGFPLKSLLDWAGEEFEHLDVWTIMSPSNVFTGSPIYDLARCFKNYGVTDDYCWCTMAHLLFHEELSFEIFWAFRCLNWLLIPLVEWCISIWVEVSL